MTQRPRPPAPPNSLEGVRDRFVNITSGTTIPTTAGDVRVSNLPLLRNGSSGLEQTVRFRLPASDDPQPVTVRLREGVQILADATATLSTTPQSVLLHLPEITSTRTVTAEILVADEVPSMVPFDLTVQRKFTIHVVHHSHYDIGYTDPQTVVMEAQLAFIDYALELATATDDWPDDARFRWNIEVNWPLRHWLRSRPRHARDALLRRIREGGFEVHALPFSMHTEAYSQDELARQLSFTRELRDEWGIEVTTAMQTDVPGITLGLASLLTDADIRYLAVAHNYAGISVPWLAGGQDLERPFWWQAPDGERLLVWYTDTLIGNAYMEAMHIGFGSGYDDVLGSLPEYLNSVMQNGYPFGDSSSWMNLSLDGVDITKRPYPHDILHLRVQGAYADNASSSLLPAEIIREWNDRWVWPKLRSSIDRDFFTDVEARLADRLPTYEGDWTDWWAVGIGSAAFAVGKTRQAQSDIRTAQTLHALADYVTDEPLPTVAEDVSAAYEEMALFDEHTWGAANPWGREASRMSSGAYQWTRKEAFAYVAEERTQTLLNGGLQRIASLAARADTSPDARPLLVFNASSWPRTDLVRVFVPRHGGDPEHVAVVDVTTGERIPALVEIPENATHRPLGRWVRFVARDVPSLGYRRYDLVAIAALTSNPFEDQQPSIATDELRLDVDLQTATVRGLIDVKGNRDLVEPDTIHGFNAHIYDRYTTAPGFNHLSSRIGSGSGPWLLGSRQSGSYGLVTDRQANDVWEQVTIRYAADGADWAESQYTLPRGTGRLHIRNRLVKPVTMHKESLYYAFPFAGDSARIDIEITGGVVGPDSPSVPGSANHFRAMGHWATITAEGGSPIAWATAEAPLVQVGNIRIPYAPFATSIPDWQAHPGTIYSWALNNIWDTNFPPAQGGELTFSYAVGVGDDDPVALGRDTGAAVSSPLVGLSAPLGAVPIADLPDAGAFVTVDHPAVEITHLAPARNGGIAIFLFSLAPETVTLRLRIQHLPIRSAASATFLETNATPLAIEDGNIQVDVAPGELKTVIVQLDT